MTCLCPSFFAKAPPVDEKNYHLGHLLFESLSTNSDKICQIDASTGQEETNASVLSRSTRLAKCFIAAGLKPGDVITVSGPNHLDLHIPFYAGLFTGQPIAALDPLYKFDEIKVHISITKPKIIFCQSTTYDDISRAVRDLRLDSRIVTFDDGKYSLAKFLQKYGKNNDYSYFRPINYNSSKTYAWLISTSGTTGGVKCAALDHKSVLNTALALKNKMPPEVLNSYRKLLNLSPVQWVSGYFASMLGPVLGFTKLQTSAPTTTEHIIDIINKFKPMKTMMGPAAVAEILNSSKKCDWSCFFSISLAGSKVPPQLITDLKSLVNPHCTVSQVYGQTETLGMVLASNPQSPPDSCGSPSGLHQIKLVDPETHDEVTENGKVGELWVKGTLFKGYYNMPEASSEVMTPDGWFRSGDLLYRDKDNNYYYYDRIKILIKYRNYHVSAFELEDLISSHKAVLHVAVTSVEDVRCGELPVACVVVRPGHTVTADEIKKLVADKLSDAKQLRGGVVFCEEIPMTSSGKIARKQLKELVKTSNRL